MASFTSSRGLSATALLLAASAMSPITAFAAPEPQTNHPRTRQPASTPATQAAPAAAHKRNATAKVQSDPEEIHVSAGRRMAGGFMKRQIAPESTSSITAAAIARKSAIASPLQLISTMPGVNYGTQDAFGLSIRNTISVRGFQQTQLGYTIEGAPGVDQAYYNPYTETYADNENLSDITLIPSTSRINDPVQSSSGGELIETVRDPSEKAGGMISYAAGSYRSQRVFGRLDSGYIGHSGIRLFGSASYTAADIFAGSGRSNKTHVDFKAIKEWGNVGRTSLFLSYDAWKNARSNPYTLAAYEAAARVNNNYSAGNYASTYVPGVTTNYWKNYIYHRNSVLISLQNEVSLGRHLNLHITPYFHWNFSNSPGQTSLNPASLYSGENPVTLDTSNLTVVNGNVSGLANTAQREYDTGVNTYLQYDPIHSNHLIFGYWFDHWNMDATSGVTPLDIHGNASSYMGKDLLYATDGSLIAGTKYQISTMINEFYLSDTQTFFNDKLKITAGLKEMMFYVSGTNQLAGPQYHFSQAITQPMPRVSISYNINKNMQVYINGTTNARPPVPLSTYPNIYSTATGAISQSGSNTARMEYTISEELGFRYYGAFNFDAAFFNANLTNHQVTTQAFINGASTNTAIAAGGQTVRGVTAEASLHPYYGFSPYVNGQYLHSTMDNNFTTASGTLRTAGKVAVLSPKFMANVGVMYTNGPFFANVTFKYVDSQYSSFMNDQSMPAYKTVDLGLGYHFPKWFILHEPVLRLNFMNLTNKAYLGGVSTVVANARPARATNGQTVAASTPAYFLAAPMTFVINVSSSF
ncbi:TonB-dependent receptor plug domain-containing protein [Gluconobacter frateurii]|uniref:TonB-dependent receptor n=1 Tax=Gluconobacter frateurii TaxID=38308 RepID=UPI001F0531CB|nr:TonB-dependent receptor plug domain-containing protein [Gluconobacter frateurii]UMM08118.1 TonB-dependent receptor plug domain-containing protein [Gluconobacter frateurii]